MKRLFGAVAALGLVAASSVVQAPEAMAGGALVNGAGSSYVALAMQQWVTDGGAQGLRINYTPTGSPDGVQRYVGTQVNFAATEAEFSSFGTTSVPRGYQYVPTVAGAVSVMYNLRDAAGRKVDYLHLSQRTVARIFLGDISRWSDPAISAENNGFKFPNEAINVVFRSGQSGTTGFFYDFVAHAEPQLFARWAAKYQAPTDVRILEMPPNFAPKTQGLATSDQIAQYLASDAGRWSISYDEFGFAKTYGANSAWIQNRAGKWVLPYATNISAALEGAKLRQDLSQELSGVYANPNPLAYPISAYSYIVAQCAPASDRATCKGAYPDKGVISTLAPWLRYIACDGQIQMARIGYSPLPRNLSQEVINSIARLDGSPVSVQLNSGNCSNPRFHGSLGAGAVSPPDPYAQLPGGVAGATGGPGTAGNGGPAPGATTSGGTQPAGG
ncbi:MAG: phosphate transporter substrate-binding protein, partial [Acidimicrobiales bacterium]|nr:phosphate transporter substrate-binding protein [Acidimicrobiales bacterium]